MSYGKRMEKVRRKYGLSYQQIAREIRPKPVDRRTVYRWLTGRTPTVPLAVVMAIAKAARRSPERVLIDMGLPLRKTYR